MTIEIINKQIFKVDGVIYNSATFTEEEFKQKFKKSKHDFFKVEKAKVEVEEIKKKIQSYDKPKDTQKKIKKT